MIGRIFWFLLGIGVAIFVVTKVRAMLKQASPEAIGHRVADSASNMGERAQDFAARVRAGMAERETEIRETFGLTE
jgi:hypothetical protein